MLTDVSLISLPAANKQSKLGRSKCSPRSLDGRPHISLHLSGACFGLENGIKMPLPSVLGTLSRFWGPPQQCFTMASYIVLYLIHKIRGEMQRNSTWCSMVVLSARALYVLPSNSNHGGGGAYRSVYLGFSVLLKDTSTLTLGEPGFEMATLQLPSSHSTPEPPPPTTACL